MGLFGPPNIDKLIAKEDIKGLIKAMNYKEIHIQKSAISALSRFGDKRAIRSLLLKLNDEDYSIRESAVYALHELSFEPSDDDNVTKAIYLVAKRDYSKCVKIGEPAIIPLINTLKYETDAFKKKAIETLGMIGNQKAIKPLKRVLVASELSIIKPIINALGKIDTSEQIITLLSIINHNDLDVRIYAGKQLSAKYKKGELNENLKKRLLKLNNKVIKEHSDQRHHSDETEDHVNHYDEAGPPKAHCPRDEHTDYFPNGHTDEGYHEDSGEIKLKFPL